jgi:hypothetical protein
MNSNKKSTPTTWRKAMLYILAIGGVSFLPIKQYITQGLVEKNTLLAYLLSLILVIGLITITLYITLKTNANSKIKNLLRNRMYIS